MLGFGILFPKYNQKPHCGNKSGIFYKRDHYFVTYLRLRVVRYFVFSKLLYGIEDWTLIGSLLEKLEAFEM